MQFIKIIKGTYHIIYSIYMIYVFKFSHIYVNIYIYVCIYDVTPSVKENHCGKCHSGHMLDPMEDHEIYPLK